LEIKEKEKKEPPQKKNPKKQKTNKEKTYLLVNEKIVAWTYIVYCTDTTENKKKKKNRRITSVLFNFPIETSGYCY
jgi:hypothetical protein